jgi:hypothetical protein
MEMDHAAPLARLRQEIRDALDKGPAGRSSVVFALFRLVDKDHGYRDRKSDDRKDKRIQ